MQINVKNYDPEQHDKFPALSVNQPYASQIGTGFKKIELRSRPIKFRGKILICSTKNPVISDMECGCTIAFVEVYDCKPISEFTESDWIETRVPEPIYKKMKKGYGWFLRNPKRVIEFPVIGQQGIFNLIYSKGVIMEYPIYARVK